jgi:hypothetical protein
VGGRQHSRSRIVPGTHRLSDVPPPATRIPRTKRLKLNLNPNRLDRNDVAKSLEACLHFLDHLSFHGHNGIAFTKETVGFKGKRLPFSSLASEVKKTLTPGFVS